mmetsp:Transcript_61548/g.170654  ORF Transcript_61548/g.170654 Transcript_61548/m.170654 type:complete len:214 (+) Transcript_61548:1093-1734(+)
MAVQATSFAAAVAITTAISKDNPRPTPVQGHSQVCFSISATNTSGANVLHPAPSADLKGVPCHSPWCLANSAGYLIADFSTSVAKDTTSSGTSVCIAFVVASEVAAGILCLDSCFHGCLEQISVATTVPVQPTPALWLLLSQQPQCCVGIRRGAGADLRVTGAVIIISGVRRTVRDDCRTLSTTAVFRGRCDHGSHAGFQHDIQGTAIDVSCL